MVEPASRTVRVAAPAGVGPAPPQGAILIWSGSRGGGSSMTECAWASEGKRIVRRGRTRRSRTGHSIATGAPTERTCNLSYLHPPTWGPGPPLAWSVVRGEVEERQVRPGLGPLEAGHAEGRRQHAARRRRGDQGPERVQHRLGGDRVELGAQHHAVVGALARVRHRAQIDGVLAGDRDVAVTERVARAREGRGQ